MSSTTGFRIPAGGGELSHRRIPKRKAVLAGAGAVGIAAAAVLLPHANASQSGSGSGPEADPRTLSAAAAQDLVSELGPQLGDAYAGAYYDAQKQQVVVNVVGDSNSVIVQVNEAGAVARPVENSMGQLKAAADTLAEKAAVPGTAWAVDPRTNQLLVTADRTVAGDDWNRLESTVKSLGSGMARIQKSAGVFKPFLEGGDAIFGGGSRCSLGFNVTTGDGQPGFLTAGHCGVADDQWSEDPNGAPIGTVQAATFPGEGDFALVTYDDPATVAPGTVDLGNGQTLDIVGADDAAVGQEVFRMGSTTGLNSGQVTGLNATVNYPEGTVTGLIQTNVCAEPGDSGGALFTRDGAAIGLTSGGSGDCTSGGETFFQPVTTALAAVGAEITTGDGGDGGGAADQGQGQQQDGQDQGQGDQDGQDQQQEGQNQDGQDQQEGQNQDGQDQQQGGFDGT
ncbi:protease [Streptomyces pristinaespiralis ATCC 25486]|uniref:Protease n=1 Tax=Streptomyces pristinaespiralis (strain ATCC 25486 / DSM 40338 / CBS 914.69 / JCM 4507 / KCC S-0507 / NBRC 13074 / NRRL 2958 / 5647) TaxID=457429 RepID=D6X9S8_STRE2|nr:protease [Streptomyces pristinaespiralis ATCC 25486]